MKIDICIFLLVLIATFVYACGPKEERAGAPTDPMVAPVLLRPRPPSAAVMMTVSTPAPAVAPSPAPAPAPIMKCLSAEFDVIMDQKNISQGTSEIVKKLKSKVILRN
ncbi:hypothetical protein X798_07635 [Onchocerca flexuosa]|uniref:Uncharacterized protein n=1 Tax=Onchocerca flexuosa TaxID=387005 RepID=A0A238BJF3_9BILA|nr:hypothetical protein X798_07635 [Onchocerca flexuosa]